MHAFFTAHIPTTPHLPPPGLGKTTLAHVCAAHCGYRPLEINASDDRGGASLQARILDAVEMQASWQFWGALYSGLVRCGVWFTEQARILDAVEMQASSHYWGALYSGL